MDTITAVDGLWIDNARSKPDRPERAAASPRSKRMREAARNRNATAQSGAIVPPAALPPAALPPAALQVQSDSAVARSPVGSPIVRHHDPAPLATEANPHEATPPPEQVILAPSSPLSEKPASHTTGNLTGQPNASHLRTPTAQKHVATEGQTAPPAAEVGAPPEDDDMPQRVFDLPMLQKQKENLVWEDCAFYVPGLVRIHTPADAHQVYHAIMNAMSVVYRQGEMAGSDITHKRVVSMIREDLAQALAATDPATGKSHYSALMGGTIAEFARSDETKTLAALQKQLIDASHLPRMLVPFICDQLAIDLYMISAATRTVEPLTNSVLDVIKNRRSVVLLYSRNHYELVGVSDARGHITTLFKPKHRFIRALRDQLDVD